MSKRFGFTLAEVLITLGIIGVIAAITIPTLILNSNNVRFRSGFKKGISTLSQAAVTASAKYGVDYGSAMQACPQTYYSGDNYAGTSDLPIGPNDKSFCGIFQRTLSAKQYYVSAANQKVKGGNAYGFASQTTLGNAASYNAYTLADGTIVGFHVYDKSGAPCKITKTQRLSQEWIQGHPGCVGFIDVNGVNLPNKEITCTDGQTTSYNVQNPCTVKNDSKSVTDIYPIVFHDTMVEPATNAAAYVFQNK